MPERRSLQFGRLGQSVAQAQVALVVRVMFAFHPESELARRLGELAEGQRDLQLGSKLQS